VVEAVERQPLTYLVVEAVERQPLTYLVVEAVERQPLTYLVVEAVERQPLTYLHKKKNRMALGQAILVVSEAVPSVLQSPPFSLNLLPWRPPTKINARGTYK
jgi:hypothetical protein